MKFNDIPGHDEAKSRLRLMADTDRLPNALLIEGPTGTGKMALARAFVQYIHCNARTSDGEPCGRCPACLQHQTFNHIDTLYVFPVVKPEKAKTAPVSDDFIEQWRDFINENTYLSPEAWADTISKKKARPTFYVPQASELIHRLSLTATASRYKCVILWQPELMPATVANKILKLIEEPFADTKFIMVSERPADILPTIYSRLQRIALRRLPDDIVSSRLQALHSLPAAEADALAHIAEGDMITASQLVNQSAARHEYLERFMTLMRRAYQRDVAGLRTWANDLAATARDREIHFYEYAIRMMRENFVFNLKVPSITYLNLEEQNFSTNFARFITHRNVERLIAQFERAITDIAANGNGKIINFDLAIKVIMLIKNA